MKRSERKAAAAQIDTLRQWGGLADRARASRKAITAAGDSAQQHLEARVLTCTVDGRELRVIPLFEEHDQVLATQLRRARLLPEPTEEEGAALRMGTVPIETNLKTASRLLTSRRFVLGSEKAREAQESLDFVLSLHDRGMSQGWETILTGLSVEEPSSVSEEALPLGEMAAEVAGSEAGIVPWTEVEPALLGRATVRSAHKTATTSASTIRSVGEALRDRDVRTAMLEMPLSALKSASSGRLRLGTLERAGLTCVQHVLDRGVGLQSLDGIGEQTVRQVMAAAQTMQALTRRETPVRIDMSAKDDRTRSLLQSLRRWALVSKELHAAGDVIAAMDDLMGKLAGRDAAAPPTHCLVATEDVALDLTQRLREVAALRDLTTILNDETDPWRDFLARPADYLGWLSEFGFLTEDAASAEGQLSEALIARVRAQDLDTSLLHDVSLRGYQDFAARFALVQRKVILGDEMGLGKTIEALAMLAHIHAKGGTHSIVVCPASVVSNWMREMLGRSNLGAYRLHGQDRLRRAHEWARRGGVAITTFETLKALHDVLDGVDVHAVVVDEAHYIKNPGAKRTRNSRALVDRADHALFLTGTPIENRLEEFENLVSYLQPKLLEGLGAYTANSFPRLIAPAYLRRNQEDVLTELPDRIDVAEWLPMSEQDESAYVEAVADGNFMAMRRAALLTGEYSEKMIRLDEIVTEARTNHRKVIVFSYFRDVLEAVAERLDGMVVGPLTGSVPAPQRQALVDEFTKAQPGAVLVSQISAGGVGLNIQAGSVVVICEPQVKPSMESQAVARAHRMGQTETVQVHRLLSEEGVDRRMVEILAEKQRLFDEFARVSHTADSAPEAFDITEAELAREVIATERERLARRIRAIDSMPPTTEEIA